MHIGWRVLDQWATSLLNTLRTHTTRLKCNIFLKLLLWHQQTITRLQSYSSDVRGPIFMLPCLNKHRRVIFASACSILTWRQHLPSFTCHFWWNCNLWRAVILSSTLWTEKCSRAAQCQVFIAVASWQTGSCLQSQLSTAFTQSFSLWTLYDACIGCLVWRWIDVCLVESIRWLVGDHASVHTAFHPKAVYRLQIACDPAQDKQHFGWMDWCLQTVFYF